jgi:hypothetical protein
LYRDIAARGHFAVRELESFGDKQGGHRSTVPK